MIIEQIKWGKREYISTNNMIRWYKSMFIKIRLQEKALNHKAEVTDFQHFE